MNIVFLVRYYWPHVGGVERHVGEVTKNLKLIANNIKITIITEKFNPSLKNREIKDGVEIIRFTYPHLKFIGLLAIWFWLWKNRSLIKQSDIIHCHDVFIWYLPFRFLYPERRVYITFHGWEGKYPIPWRNIFQKRLAAKLSRGNICVGKYIEKWYGIKANKIVYGGLGTRQKALGPRKNKRYITYLGRLEKDTGLLEFLQWFSSLAPGYKVDFVGDGSLRKECEKYGTVHGFCDPAPFLQKTGLCVPGGYLAYLEALSAGCKIKIFWDNPLKRDYWQEIGKIKKFPTWEEVADEYLGLYYRS